MNKDNLGSRMKTYEATTKNFLLRRTPVIIRIDGRAFHTYSKRFNKLVPNAETPFNEYMHELMVVTTKELVNGIQNCVFGYTQSDEISLLLRDWDQNETQQWFGGSVQKIVSVSASIATAAFNYWNHREQYTPKNFSDMAQFDSRVYNLPEAEVVNYFIWRQQDASRNSVQMLGHHHFSQREMHGKSNSEVQDMLMLQKNINWDDLPTWMKRGTCFTPDGADEEIPVFTQDRFYVAQHLETALVVADFTLDAQGWMWTNASTGRPT